MFVLEFFSLIILVLLNTIAPDLLLKQHLKLIHYSIMYMHTHGVVPIL